MTSATRVETHAGIAHASQKRGQSVSDGATRVSFCVFAATLQLKVSSSRQRALMPSQVYH